MREVVRLEGLTKDYGRSRALDGVDLAVSAGEVFGYLGPNGAGKTTTLRLLLGLLRPTAGTARVFGLDSWADSVAIHARTGYLPGEPSLYGRLTGAETVEYFSRLRGRPDDVRTAGELAERLDLDLGPRVRTLSRGNRQKLAIVLAFMSGPELLVLDEPISGLDPLVQLTFHQLVLEVAAAGATVLLSSHILDEVERVADRVGIIRRGRLVAVERLDELKAKAVHRVEARLAGPVSVDAFASIDGIRQLRLAHGVLSCGVPERSLDELVKTLGRWRVLDLAIAESDLEEMFLTYYASEASDAA